MKFTTNSETCRGEKRWHWVIKWNGDKWVDVPGTLCQDKRKAERKCHKLNEKEKKQHRAS